MTLQEFPRPQGLFNGLGQYRPTPTSKLSALTNYLKVAKNLLPKQESFRASVMWHNDLHANNIFVNPEKPTEIVAIIDWQSVHLTPFFLQARHPALIEFNGQIPEGFGRVELPENFADLSADEQKERRCSGPRSHSTNSTRSNCANETRTSSARCNTARLWLAQLPLWLARFSAMANRLTMGYLWP